MTEQTYLVLTALLDGPLHGYAVIKRVEQLSRGRVRLAAGSLYAALDRLNDEGLIAVRNEEVINGRARRYYGLTDDGTGMLQAEAARMTDAARLVSDRRLRQARAVKPA